MDFKPSVVVHFKNGEIKKGFTKNFAFFREIFDLAEVDSETKEEVSRVEVRLEDLKAVFFVKDFDGNPKYSADQTSERHGFGDKLEVTFKDNETMIGYTPRYHENNNGFILYPADPNINNEIVAVVRSATQSIKQEKKHSFFFSA